MTINEITNAVWIDCGEPSDIDPATVAGDTFFSRVLTQAMDGVVTWKGFQGNRRAHFIDYISSMFLKNKTEDVEVSVDSGDVIEVVANPTTFTVAAGDILEYDGEYRLIYNIDTTQYYLDSAFSATPLPAGSVLTVRQKLLDPGLSRVSEFTKMENIDTRQTLDYLNLRNINIDDIINVSEPNDWRRSGTSIEFDVVPDDVYLWRLWYYRLPTQVTTLSDDAFDVPEDFHPAVKAYMEAVTYDHMQEIEMSVGLYKTFDQLMKTIQGPWERRNMISETQAMRMKTS